MAGAGAGLSMWGAYRLNTDKARTQHDDPKWEGDYASIDELAREIIRKRMMQKNNDSYWNAYESGMIRNTNNTYGQVGSTLANVMAQRGLSRSPVAASALSNLHLSRASDIAQAQSQMPILRRQQEAQDLETLLRYLQLTRSLETRYPGDAWGAALSAGGESLAGSSGLGVFGK
jgi:hypothetical protein